MNESKKIFRDPIYGYISIPKEYCNDIIDTAIFQRLRRIEQTGMRTLYPSAHHDRFAHSIGVFHLGCIAFNHLKKNSKLFWSEINEDCWEKYRKTFEIACLLHDCGHSPFSHTFENYYLLGRGEEIKNEIRSHTNDINFIKYDYGKSTPSSHEKISALLLLKNFKDAIVSMGGNPDLAARMILGCKHQSKLNDIKRFENRLISLLNGSGFDVDCLDYIQRDSWASGVSNVNIDYHRLLSSVMIKRANKRVELVLHKKVLSVIDNILIGRNHLYKWTHLHHKVCYEQNLLVEIVKKINDDNNEFLHKCLFTHKAFAEPQTFEGKSYFLPTDDDLMHVIKQYRATDPKIEEFLSRKHKLKALWKTHFEFDFYFKIFDKVEILQLPERLKDFTEFKSGDMICIQEKEKLKSIESGNLSIEVDDKFIDASTTCGYRVENKTYFIVYVSDRLLPMKQKIINKILKLKT